jgi:predicted metalloprotease with PDZ domain
MAVTVATAPGSELDVPRLLRFYERTIPLLVPLLGTPPRQLVVVSAPDPMWRGGISGEGSFYVNGRLPIRSHDRTSTFLHELIHVWQPFRPVGDGRWVSEGLAEYYSLVVQRRAGLISAAGFARGIELFARHGRWDVDLSRSHDAAALNNSAPLVLHWLDIEIARVTDGKRSLDDAVRRLAADGSDLTTATFLRAVNRTAGKDFTPQFRRYVFRGTRPPVADEPLAIGPGLPARASVRYRPQAPEHRPCPQCPA